jgi:hypothetical protein
MRAGSSYRILGLSSRRILRVSGQSSCWSTHGWRTQRDPTNGRCRTAGSSPLGGRDVLSLLMSGLETVLNEEGYGLVVPACVGFGEHQGGGEPAKLLRAAEDALHSAKHRWGPLGMDCDAVHRVRCRLARTPRSVR